MSKKKKIILAVVGVFVALMVIAAIADSGETATKSTDTVKAEPKAEKKAEPKPKAEKKAEPKPKAEKLTVSQENALESAEGYIDFGGFSKSGLIDQVKFEGFSEKDAKFAANKVDANWNAEAVETAKGYLDMSSFSRQGLIDQLKFEGFTSNQAAQAADKVGLRS